MPMRYINVLTTSKHQIVTQLFLTKWQKTERFFLKTYVVLLPKLFKGKLSF